MPIFNMVGSGNGGENLPIGSRIIVTSNEGAVIKCAKGSTVEEQTVPANRVVTFVVHQSGTWQITATKSGETTKTDTVAVLADNTDYEKKMLWRLWLYKDGDECSSLTGGWNEVGYTIDTGYSPTPATLTKNPTNMNIVENSSGNKSSRLKTTNTINVTGYTSLNAHIVSASATYTNLQMGCHEFGDPPYSSGATILSTAVPSVSDFTATLDISGYTGQETVGFGHWQWASHNLSMTVDKVWLDP